MYVYTLRSAWPRPYRWRNWEVIVRVLVFVLYQAC